ncbi:Vesicle-associated membrane protein 4-like [Scleropages formosus]|uniref:Vesicle-associated membrane protein 4-like n=1 Tax=Scleropages formosus TaxID=113540 RepID=A0A0P7UFX6_SCLFO|nr:Vesicle-associated membrane protein 4-like [Scleropages formosus]
MGDGRVNCGKRAEFRRDGLEVFYIEALTETTTTGCHDPASVWSPPEREPEREEQPTETMPPKFKRHLNDDEVTGSVRSERRNLLEEDSDEEEDFFLRGPTAPKFGPKNDKIRQVQNQVDEVIDVMQENISKVIERGERLDELQDKSESLSDNASAFSSRAKHLHRRMWWRDMKFPSSFSTTSACLRGWDM